MTDWTEQYRPSTLSAIRGNDKARDAFAEWAKRWDDHREAVVVHGSPGVGKTSAAHALANDMGWETVELNASDQRTADVIERLAGRAAKNATLGGSIAAAESGNGAAGRQLVIVDEADNIHGTYDRGGSGAITRLVKASEQPIVLIANDYYEMSRGLRNATREIEFRDVSARSILPVLRDICRKEDVEFETDALEAIAERNSGDLRGAVNDLQAAVETGGRVTLEDVVTGDRDRTVGLFPFLDAVLKEEPAESAIRSAYDVDETPDDLTKWIEHNLLSVYEPGEAAAAYEFLANADRWLGRVRASQEYSYWRYVTDNTAGGVAAARSGTKGGWTRYSRPQFWPSSDNQAEAVSQRIAERSGVSIDIARREILPFLAAMTHHCKPRELTVEMAAAYDFDESDVSFVTGSGETTNKVESIVEDAQKRREERIESHSGGAFEPVDTTDGTRMTDDVGNSIPDDDTTETSDRTETTPSQQVLGERSADAPETDAGGGDGSKTGVADDGDTDSDDSQAGLSDFF